MYACMHVCVCVCVCVKYQSLTPKRTGRIYVDNHLRVLGEDHSNVYAIGDCALPVKMNLPPTAQVAQQQGKYLVKLLNKMVGNKEHPKQKPFIYHHQGMMAYLGMNVALLDAPYVKGSGFLAWVFWRSAYFTKLVSIRNKILVPMVKCVCVCVCTCMCGCKCTMCLSYAIAITII